MLWNLNNFIIVTQATKLALKDGVILEQQHIVH